MLFQAEEERNDKILFSPQHCFFFHVAFQKHMGDGFIAMTFCDTAHDWVIIIF